MMNGIFLLDKEAGESSARAIARLKRKLALEKIGHAGTLDPMATGLLVCLSGRATKLAALAQGGEKVYSGTILLGRRTDSDDVTGKTVSESNALPAWEQVLNAAQEFKGLIEQIPPQISALKVDGKRAYRRARAGETVELRSRAVKVRTFELSRVSDSEFAFRINCDGGTYIRSIARDMGEKLGCGGCLQTLRREGSGPFRISRAKTVNEIGMDDLLPCAVESEFNHLSARELCPV